ncbi:MAG: iron-containing alcohol dehydrogenase [Thermovirgaceae bacterium]
MDNPLFTFSAPGNVIFGEYSSRRIVDVLSLHGVSNPGIMMGRTLSKTAIREKVVHILEEGGYRPVVFDGIPPEPPVGILDSVAAKVKEAGLDVLIGLGGGSTMDFTKVVSVLAKDGMDVMSLVGRGRVPRRGLPTVMMPTTAGSGSEVSPVAIFTFPEEQVKKGVVSPFLMPDAAIVDPAFTLDLPARVTANTGVDAFIHAVESYLSVNANPFSRELSLAAVRKIYPFLHIALKDGHDRKARYNMSLGSLLAGMAFAMAGTAAVHALAYPLGGEFHFPHGTANAVMLRSVMEANLEGNEALFGVLSDTMRESAGEKRYRGDVRKKALDALSQMTSFAREAGIPSRLKDLGIPSEALPRMALAASREKRLLGNNPKTFTVKDIERIYRDAW